MCACVGVAQVRLVDRDNPGEDEVSADDLDGTLVDEVRVERHTRSDRSTNGMPQGGPHGEKRMQSDSDCDYFTFMMCLLLL